MAVDSHTNEKPETLTRKVKIIVRRLGGQAIDGIIGRKDEK
jgi:hypothetical protein